jgi:hypothetical protein
MFVGEVHFWIETLVIQIFIVEKYFCLLPIIHLFSRQKINIIFSLLFFHHLEQVSQTKET